MTDNDRRAELEMMLLREAVSVAAIALVLVVCSPGVRIWVKQQLWRVRRHQTRAAQAEEAMIAELRRDLSRIEHGQVEL